MPIIDPEKLSNQDLDSEIKESRKNELPAKYQGKTPEEIATMHMNAEAALSRQGQTLGEQRKVIDQFIQLQLSEKSQKQEQENTPVTADALFQDPDKVINQAVDRKVKEVNQTVDNLKLQLRAKEFEAKHEGKVREILTDPAFGEFVQGSPHRQRLAQHLDRYDFDSGDELLGLWRDYQEINDIKAKKEEVKQRRQNQMQAARTETTSAGGESSPKTTFSRLQLSELMTRAKGGDKEAAAKWNNPSFQAEVRQAYVDGRVK